MYVKKLLDVLRSFDTNFRESDGVTNVVSKAVHPKNACIEILNRNKIGNDLYNNFTDKRIKGSVSIWAPITKRKLLTFEQEGKSNKIHLQNKVVQLTEECTLLSRFLITARKRPEIDLEEVLVTTNFLLYQNQCLAMMVNLF